MSKQALALKEFADKKFQQAGFSDDAAILAEAPKRRVT